MVNIQESMDKREGKADIHDPSSGFTDWLYVLPLYLLPQHLLSRCMYAITRWRFRLWKNGFIKWFIKAFDVDMSIAKEPEPKNYSSFNDFFTRELVEEARPIAGDPAAVACPVDGSVSQIGEIDNTRIFQAKGRHYTLVELLVEDHDLVNRFRGGSFATLYLSPRDYHRIHMPLSGGLQKMVYVPGRLFPVNQRSVLVVNRLFARNERVISIFETEAGWMAMIMVGAIFVGGMDTVWHGSITPSRGRDLQTWDYDGVEHSPVHLEKGQEMGRFNMGSTVILLFEAGRVNWLAELRSGASIEMGRAIGTW